MFAEAQILNSIPFRQRLWESFPAKNEGKLSDQLCGNICLNSSSFQQSLSETHVGSSQLDPPILNILSWGPVAQPVGSQQKKHNLCNLSFVKDTDTFCDVKSIFINLKKYMLKVSGKFNLQICNCSKHLWNLSSYPSFLSVWLPFLPHTHNMLSNFQYFYYALMGWSHWENGSNIFLRSNVVPLSEADHFIKTLNKVVWI